MTINEIANAIHQNAVDHGWWDCPTCNGMGEIDTADVYVPNCPTCNGNYKFRNVGESLALIHSEVSEALEAKRDPKDDDLCDKCDGLGDVQPPMFNLLEPCQKCDGTGHALGGSRFGEELADIVIRVMDLAVAEGIDLEATILAKHAYNVTRPHKHGRQVND